MDIQRLMSLRDACGRKIGMLMIRVDENPHDTTVIQRLREEERCFNHICDRLSQMLQEKQEQEERDAQEAQRLHEHEQEERDVQEARRLQEKQEQEERDAQEARRLQDLEESTSRTTLYRPVGAAIGFGPHRPMGAAIGFGPHRPVGVVSGFGPHRPVGVVSGFGPHRPVGVVSGFGPHRPVGVVSGFGPHIMFGGIPMPRPTPPRSTPSRPTPSRSTPSRPTPSRPTPSRQPVGAASGSASRSGVMSLDAKEQMLQDAAQKAVEPFKVVDTVEQEKRMRRGRRVLGMHRSDWDNYVTYVHPNGRNLVMVHSKDCHLVDGFLKRH